MVQRLLLDLRNNLLTFHVVHAGHRDLFLVFNFDQLIVDQAIVLRVQNVFDVLKKRSFELAQKILIGASSRRVQRARNRS